MSHVTEAVRQVQQRGGERQVARPRVGVRQRQRRDHVRGVRVGAGGRAVSRPRPVPSPTTRPFWDATAEQRFLIQRCAGVRRGAVLSPGHVHDVRLADARLGAGRGAAGRCTRSPSPGGPPTRRSTAPSRTSSPSSSWPRGRGSPATSSTATSTTCASACRSSSSGTNRARTASASRSGHRANAASCAGAVPGSVHHERRRTVRWGTHEVERRRGGADPGLARALDPGRVVGGTDSRCADCGDAARVGGSPAHSRATISPPPSNAGKSPVVGLAGPVSVWKPGRRVRLRADDRGGCRTTSRAPSRPHRSSSARPRARGRRGAVPRGAGAWRHRRRGSPARARPVGMGRSGGRSGDRQRRGVRRGAPRPAARRRRTDGRRIDDRTDLRQRCHRGVSAGGRRRRHRLHLP